MLLFDMYTTISQATVFDERDHAVQYSPTFFDGHEFIFVFSSDDWTCMDTVIGQTAIGEIFFKLAYWLGYVV